MTDPAAPVCIDTVEYAAVRDTIRDGDIVLFAGMNAFSRMIRRVTRSPYSHAGLAAWWGETLIVMEAKGSGVHAARLSHVVKRYKGGAELWTTVDDATESLLQREKVIKLAKTELGKPYNIWKLAAYLRRMIAFKLGLHQSEQVAAAAPDGPSPENFICSEYVSYVWRHGGLPLCGELDHYTTPRDISASEHLKRVGALVCNTLRVPCLDATAPDPEVRKQAGVTT